MKLYRIDFWSEVTSKWLGFGMFSTMRKTAAEGAWSMLESCNPWGKYRLVSYKIGDAGKPVMEETIEEFEHFTVQANAL